MEQNLSREDIIATYRPDIMKLASFLPWLKSKTGQSVSHSYKGADDSASTMPFPVFDSQVFSLVKAIEQTHFLNRNYVYTYSNYRLKTVEDELALLPKLGTMDMKVLGDILSKYVIKGQSKTALWSEAVNKGVFLAVILRMCELADLHQNNQ